MDSPGEILRLCRLCLVKDQVNIPIFEEEGDSREIFLKISSCLPVKVSREDRLPKKICDGCSEKLNSFYEFWSSSANAEKTLLSWVGEEDVEEKKEPAVSKSLAASATLVKEESELVDEAHAESIEESTKDEADEAPPAKRARRSAAVKAQINLAPDSEDDDLDMGEPLTKTEEESAESDGEDKDPSYTDMPGTSADDEQAGPSGMGKDGVEAPFNRMNLFEKAAFLKTHFSKECRIILTDFTKTVQNPKTTDNRRRKRYSCYVCFEKFLSSLELEAHKLVHQDEEEEETSKNQETEVNKVDDSPPVESNYKCITCDANFIDQLEVKAHVHTQYRCKYFCKRCSRFFNTKGGFIVHLIQHSMDNTVKLSYRCEKCSSTFDDCYKLKRHYVTVHSNNSSHNKEREKKTEKPVNTVSLSDPANPITGIIPIFDCDVCYDVFASKKALEKHKALHNMLDKKEAAEASICIEDDEESPKEFNKIETTSQITQMLGGKVPIPKLLYPNQKNSPQPSTSTTASTSYMIQTNPPATSTAPPILLNPTLPSHSIQQSMVNISTLDPSKTYYVVLPKEVKSQNTQMIPATVVPKLTKVKPAPVPPTTTTSTTNNFVMPVITSFGTVTEDVTSKKRTDPTSQYESEYAKFLTHNKTKKPVKKTQEETAVNDVEVITIVDPEPAVGSSQQPYVGTQQKIFVKKFAQVCENDDVIVDSKVDCAFCGKSLKNSAAYREHFASHHF